LRRSRPLLVEYLPGLFVSEMGIYPNLTASCAGSNIFR
jgi:hypothetical protein